MRNSSPAQIKSAPTPDATDDLQPDDAEDEEDEDGQALYCAAYPDESAKDSPQPPQPPLPQLPPKDAAPQPMPPPAEPPKGQWRDAPLPWKPEPWKEPQPGNDKPALTWEQVQKNAGALDNYLAVRSSVVDLVPFLSAELPALNSLSALKVGTDIEQNLEDFLQSTSPAARQAAWQKLRLSCQADTAGLVISPQDEATRALLKGQDAPAPTAAADTKLLVELLNNTKGKNFEAMIQLYPVAVRFVEFACTAAAAQFRGMKVGEKDDAAAVDRFVEGCPFPRPKYDGAPMQWELFLTKMAQGEIPIAIPKEFAGALTFKGASQFLDAAEWMQLSQSYLQGEQRNREVADLWRVLQERFKAPDSWAPPPNGSDNVTVDAWFNAANRVRNELVSLREYTQAYLTVKDILPEQRNSALRDLRRQGFIIEWDEESKKLTRFVPPYVKSLKLQAPEVENTVNQWTAVRKQLAEPVDKVFASMDRGETAFVRHGVFAGEKGFVLKVNGLPAFICSAKLDARGDVVEPGPIVTYIRRAANGQEEVIDMNAQGQFITKDKVNVTAEVQAHDPKKFAEDQRTQFDYVIHRVSTNSVDNGKGVELTCKREFMKDSWANYQYWGGTTLFSLERKQDEQADKYVPVVSSASGRLKFVRADEIGGIFGWKAGQIAGDTASTVGSVALDAAMLYAGGAGIVRGVASRAWGSVGLNALRFSCGAGGYLAPTLRQSAEGRDALKAIHYGILADIAVVGLGGSALSLFSKTSAAVKAESLLLADRVAGRAMLAGGFLIGPSIYNDIEHLWKQRQGRTAAQLADAAAGKLSATSAQVDVIDRPFDTKDPQRKQDVATMLQGQEQVLCSTGVSDKTAVAVRSIFARTREAMNQPADAAQRQALKLELAKALTRNPVSEQVLTQTEMVAAASCLILLNTDATGKVNPILCAAGGRQYKYEKALAILEKGLVTSVSGTIARLSDDIKRRPDLVAHELKTTWGLDKATIDLLFKGLDRAGSLTPIAKMSLTLLLEQKLEPARLHCADMLFALGKLPSRKLAAVCADILENRALPNELRVRALFDPLRPRLGLLLNELQAEEQNIPADGRPAFLGNVHGYRTADLEKLLLTVARRDGTAIDCGEKKAQFPESADLRAACILALQVMQQPDSEKRFQLTKQFSAKVNEFLVQTSGKPVASAEGPPVAPADGNPTAPVPAKPAAVGSLAAWTVQRLRADAEAAPFAGEASSVKESAAAKLRAVCFLQALGNVDGRQVLSPKEANLHLLGCIYERPGEQPGQSKDVTVVRGSTLLVDVIEQLDMQALSINEKQNLLRLLSTPTNNERSQVNDEIAAAKIKLMQRLPELIAGTDPESLQVRLLARQALQSNLQEGLSDPNRISLRQAIYTAIGKCGFDDQDTLKLLEAAFKRNERTGEWLELSSLARRAALEAQFKLSRNDAGRTAEECFKHETDAALARRFEQIIKEQRVRDGKGADQQQLRQQMVSKLSNPQEGLRAAGQALLDEKFPLLTFTALNEKYQQLLNNERGGAWTRLWASKSDKQNQVVRATELAQKEYEQAINDLCRQALHTDPHQARPAILAMAHMLDTQCAAGWRGYASFMQQEFALTLKQLCEKPNENRNLAYTLTTGYLQQKSVMDWGARCILYSGFRELARNGAIDKGEELKIILGTLGCVREDQTFPTDPQQQDLCVQLLTGCLDDLKRLHPRDRDSLAALQSIADFTTAKDGPWTQPQFAALARHAQHVHQRITRSAFMALTEHQNKGSVAPPAELADRLSNAYTSYQLNRLSGRRSDEDSGRDTRNLLDAIFQCTEGIRITSKNDPRVLLLATLGFTAEDPVVAEAAALALMRVEKDPFVIVKGYMLFASLPTENNPILAKDIESNLQSLQQMLAKKLVEQNPGMKPEAAQKAVEPAIRNLRETARSKNEGARAIGDVVRLLVPAAPYDERTAHRQAEEWQRLFDKKSGAADIIWNLACAVQRCALSKDDPRLPVLRKMLTGNCADSVALAVCAEFIGGAARANPADAALVNRCLHTLGTKSQSDVVRREALDLAKRLAAR